MGIEENQLKLYDYNHIEFVAKTGFAGISPAHQLAYSNSSKSED